MRFATLGNAAHQFRDRLEIPVGERRIAMPEIRRQHQHVFRDVIPPVRTGPQSTDRERVPKRMGRGVAAPASRWQPQFGSYRPECTLNV